MTISKSERTELRSIVRAQFKVLRAEVEQRQAELIDDSEQEIAARFADEDQRRAQIEDRMREIAEAASREITDLLIPENVGVTIRRPYRLRADRPAWSGDERTTLRRQVRFRVEAQVKAARVKLDRQEADLLRTLAIGLIESDEARAFLNGIPAVGELVPSARLAELTAEVEDE